MAHSKNFESKKDYRNFLEEALSFFEKNEICSDSAISLLNLFKEEVVIKRHFKDKKMLRYEIAEALEGPFKYGITNFIVKEMDGWPIAQNYLSEAFYGATIYENLDD